MNNQAFSKIWILVIIIGILAGGFLAWQYLVPKGKVKEVIQEEESYWIENGKEIWKKNAKGEIKLLARATELSKEKIEEIKEEWKLFWGIPPEELEKFDLTGGIVGFVLSPDRKYMVYEEIVDYYYAAGHPQPVSPITWIWIMKVDGTEKVKIERPTGEEVEGRELMIFNKWFPDSRRILFYFKAIDEVVQGSPFYEVGVDGKNPKIFTAIYFEGEEIPRTIHAVGTDPVFSPDGRKMAYIRAEEEEVWLANIDGTGKKRILKTHLPLGLPSEKILWWSKDGNLLTVRGVDKTFNFNKEGGLISTF